MLIEVTEILTEDTVGGPGFDTEEYKAEVKERLGVVFPDARVDVKVKMDNGHALSVRVTETEEEEEAGDYDTVSATVEQELSDILDEALIDERFWSWAEGEE